MPRNSHRNNNESACRLVSGYTLTECLAVIAILSVLLCMAAPSLSSILLRKQIDYVCASWFQAAAHARQLAWNSDRVVVLEPRRDRSWQHGWQIRDEASDDVLQVFDAPSRTVRLVSNGARFRFVPASAGVSTAGRIIVSAMPGTSGVSRQPEKYQRSVVVSFTGKIRRTATGN